MNVRAPGPGEGHSRDPPTTSSATCSSLEWVDEATRLCVSTSIKSSEEGASTWTWIFSQNQGMLTCGVTHTWHSAHFGWFSKCNPVEVEVYLQNLLSRLLFRVRILFARLMNLVCSHHQFPYQLRVEHHSPHCFKNASKVGLDKGLYAIEVGYFGSKSRWCVLSNFIVALFLCQKSS
jgi:hypothetical protein